MVKGFPHIANKSALVSKVDAFLGLSDKSKRLQFAYHAARPSRLRSTPDRLMGPENPTAQRDAIMLMRRARELTENSGFYKNIKGKFVDYALGSPRYIPQTGNDRLNQQVKDFFDEWQKNSDATYRFNFITQCRILFGCSLDDGDHAFIHIVDEDGNYRIQNIEADRIGNPYAITNNPDVIRGVVLENSRPVAYEIYKRTLFDSYEYEATIDANLVTHYYSPDRYDQYRGVSAFATVVDLYEDVKTVRRYEMAAIKWASSKAGFIKTNNGDPAPEDDFPNNFYDYATVDGERVEEILPGQIIYGQAGEEIEVISHDRPNPNLMAFLDSFLREGASGLKVPYEFVYNAAELNGTAVRLVSAQAQRTFEERQRELHDRVLEPVKNRAILSGIAQGFIDWDENVFKGHFVFPPHPTVDAGRDTKSELDVFRAGLSTASEYCAASGGYWKEVYDQKSIEVDYQMELAQKLADKRNVPFQVAFNSLGLVTPNGISTQEEEKKNEDSVQEARV